MSMARDFSNVMKSLVAAIVMLVLAIIGFFITVFVVDTGAGLAGFTPEGNYVILSATILVAAAVLAGGK